ncbi:MAG: GNAT family N-acetyltransferase [Candidatus Delongbacteria bacterium]
MKDYIIRKYEIGDRNDVRSIAADNAFIGQPVENIMDDRDFFNDIFMDAYLKDSSAFGFVAVFDGKVKGYIVGTDNSDKFRSVKLKYIIRTLYGILLFRYRIRARTLKYILRRLRSMIRKEKVRTDLSDYPAHLHIDIDKKIRGKGVGSALMHAFLNKIQKDGIQGVHLSTTSHNEAAVKMYSKFGFGELKRGIGTEFDGMVEKDLYNLTMGLRFR